MGAIAGSLTFEGEKLESPGPSVVGHFEFPQAHAARWGGSFIDWGRRRKARHGGHESDGGVQAPAPEGRNELAQGRKPWEDDCGKIEPRRGDTCLLVMSRITCIYSTDACRPTSLIAAPRPQPRRGGMS